MRHASASIIALSLPILVLSACSAQKAEESAPAADAAVASSVAPGTAAADKAGPGITGAVAPGVAFTYAYAFALPTKAISAVQQEHAAACFKLGPSRCRVTGVSYEQPHADEASGRLDFLLAPDIAHGFANEGIAAVEKADGTVRHASVNGANAGDAIKLSQQNSAAVEAEIARIEQRLQASGLTKGERVELQQQIASLREQLRGAVADRKAREASIATTPVSFVYVSQGLIGGSSTFGRAAQASWGSLEAALSFVLVAGGLALPWLLLAGLLALAWRGVRRARVSQVTASKETAV